jgi:hypothetical protein
LATDKNPNEGQSIFILGLYSPPKINRRRQIILFLSFIFLLRERTNRETVKKDNRKRGIPAFAQLKKTLITEYILK